ncbi:hypothetical protein [Metallosphaera tengchongensis]|nr:hypothetical protein [Metallosphaera tengchongensis]
MRAGWLGSTLTGLMPEKFTRSVDVNLTYTIRDGASYWVCEV